MPELSQLLEIKSEIDRYKIEAQHRIALFSANTKTIELWTRDKNTNIGITNDTLIQNETKRKRNDSEVTNNSNKSNNESKITKLSNETKSIDHSIKLNGETRLIDHSIKLSNENKFITKPNFENKIIDPLVKISNENSSIISSNSSEYSISNQQKQIKKSSESQEPQFNIPFKPSFVKPDSKIPKPKKNLPPPPTSTSKEKRRLSKLDYENVDQSLDSSKQKPNQIPLAQFYSYLEQFFRPIVEEDLKYLETNNDDLNTLTLPPLGKHYLEQWKDEDLLFDGSGSYEQHNMSICHETENTVYPGDAYFGTLWQRFISALLPDPSPSKPKPINSTNKESIPDVYQTPPLDLIRFERDLKEELTFLGIYVEPNDNEKIELDPDDEIGNEIINLQEQLKHQTNLNQNRKTKLLNLAQKWMAWQEYNTLLDQINKQIENAYNRKFRNPKSKKKKSSNVIGKEPVGPLESVVNLLEKRRKIVEHLAKFFNVDRFTMPTESIYDE